VLVNPANAANAGTTLRDVDAAARAFGFQIQVLNSSTSREIDAAFAAFVRERPDMLFVGSDPFFNNRRVQLALLAARHAVPVISGEREFGEAGGLMSYGSSLADAFRQLGVYAGRILRAPSRRTCRSCRRARSSWSSTPETARMLGLTVPASLLAGADEVIE
jgi:putative ABC transport system substrate-binding protein